MAINKKLIHFNKRSTFDNELNKGNIVYTSIVWIKDTKQIWTHGQIYDCDLTNYAKKEEILAELEKYYTQEQLSDIFDELRNEIGNIQTETLTLVDQKLTNKVDKVSGKELSSNDYTTEEKVKLANFPNIVSISNSDYSNLATKDPNTLYLVW